MNETNDYLAHYGVLGMRWGVRHDKEYKATKRGLIGEYYRTTDAIDRRSDAGYSAAKRKYEAAKKGASLHDKRAAKKAFKAETKRLDAELNARYNKADEKYKKGINKAKVKAADRLYSTKPHRANVMTQTQSTGKALAKSLLMGSYGAMQYNNFRSAGHGRLTSGVLGVILGAGNVMFGLGTFSVIDYVRDRENRPNTKR